MSLQSGAEWREIIIPSESCDEIRQVCVFGAAKLWMENVCV